MDIRFKWGEREISAPASFDVFRAVEESGVSVGEVYEELLKASASSSAAKVRWTSVSVFMTALLSAITKKPVDAMSVHAAIVSGDDSYEYVKAIAQMVEAYFPKPSPGKAEAASSAPSTSESGSA